MGEEEKEKKEKSKGKGRKRLVRFLVLLFAGWLVAKGARALIEQGSQGERKLSFQLPIKEKMESWGENILGSAVKLLPGAPDWGEIKSEQVNQVNQETEPIKQPTENIQKQTELLFEMIKELPQEQLGAVKKQLCQDFCQRLSEEEDD